MKLFSRSIKADKLVLSVTVLLILSVLLLVERSGSYYERDKSQLPDVLPEEYTFSELTPLDKECLVITDLGSGAYDEYLQQISLVLDSMCVGFDIYDLSGTVHYDLNNYSRFVLALDSISALDTELTVLLDLVSSGASLLAAIPLSPSAALRAAAACFGVENGYEKYIEIRELIFKTDFMVGANGYTYTFSEPVQTARVETSRGVLIHAVSDEDVPLIWEYTLGSGTVVVNNISFPEGLPDGLLAAEYSLLGDCFAWPVINSSIFYIEGVYAPIPDSGKAFVEELYGREAESFYIKIWLPDMEDISAQNNIKLSETKNAAEDGGFNKWQAINLLNIHYTSTLSVSFRAVYDPVWGAARGWSDIKAGYSAHLRWLTDSAPKLRSHTAKERETALRLYSLTGIYRAETEKSFQIKAENYYDPFYCLVRLSSVNPRSVAGGSMYPVSSDIYLLRMSEPLVTIEFNESAG